VFLLDSSGWIECVAEGPLYHRFSEYLKDPSSVVTPSIVLYEVYRKVKREKGEDKALQVVALMQQTKIVELDEYIALSAADVSLIYSLHMADAIVYATGLRYEAPVVTADEHFEKLDNVVYFPKTDRTSSG